MAVGIKLTREELDKLLAYGIALTRQRDDAMDLLQTCLEQYLTRNPSDVQQPVAYLRRMMRNRFIDDQRWHRRRDNVVFDEVLHSPNTERELESILVDEIAVESVWRTMTEAEREIVYFWAVQGLTAAEIALHLAVPRGTVLSRLHRVRKRLAKFDPAEGNQNRV